MRLKQRVGDFQVRELLTEGYLCANGDHRVYRVIKRKLTTPEAVRALASEAGVDPGAVAIAGLKDRQGITTQHMSVPAGRPVSLKTPELKIEAIGCAREEMRSEFSRGNAFELTVRALESRALGRLRRNLPLVREHGLINYFDDQRFGNITHGQAWIAKLLMLGKHEQALRELLIAQSPRDDERHGRFKEVVRREWGNWRECRAAAGRFGEHHSVFEHLQKHPTDFAGAFTFVASRLRLIHLYAWQSHLWNRAVVAHVRRVVPLADTVVMDGIEGPLLSYAGERSAALAADATFRLPGEGLDDVSDPGQLDLLEDVLATEGMVSDQLRIEGVSGFRLKGEDRELVVTPKHLRVRPAAADPMNRGARMIRVRFELPRGTYATLVVKRLFAQPYEGHEERERRARHRQDVAAGAARGPGRRDRGDRGGHPPRGGGRDRDERRGGGGGPERGERRASGGGRDHGDRRERGDRRDRGPGSRSGQASGGPRRHEGGRRDGGGRRADGGRSATGDRRGGARDGAKPGGGGGGRRGGRDGARDHGSGGRRRRYDGGRRSDGGGPGGVSRATTQGPGA